MKAYLNIGYFIGVLIYSWVGISNCYAQNLDSPIQYKSEFGTLSLGDAVYHRVDSNHLTVDSISKLNFVKDLSPKYYAKKEITFWTRVIVRNATSNTHFIITLDQWDEIIMHYQINGKWERQESGNFVPTNMRSIIFHRFISFDLDIPTNRDVAIYFEARNSRPLTMFCAEKYSFLKKIEIGASKRVFEKYLSNQQIVYFLIGASFILALYSLLLFVIDGQRTSLILFMYLVFVALDVYINYGLTRMNFITGLKGYEFQLLLHLAHLIPIITAIYLLGFFRFGPKQWEYYALVLFIVFVATCWLLGSIFSKSYLFTERRVIEVILFSTITIWSSLKNRSGSRILLLAIMATIFAKYHAEIKSISFDSKYFSFTSPELPYLIALFAAEVIFSIAASLRIRSIRQELNMALKREREIIRNQNTNLQEEVQLKTLELREKNKLLEEHFEELHTQSIAIKELNLRLENMLSERTTALENITSDFNIFLYRTAHDLRRPLTTILGITNLIENESDSSVKNELVNLINTCVRDLDAMIKKMIVISYCHDDSPVEVSDCWINDILTATVEGVSKSMSITPQQIKIATTLPDEFMVCTNHYILKEVIKSLIENSIQYGGVGVEITIKLEQRAQLVFIEFSDNGPGIELIYRDRIFDIFFRANERSKGNGLGLYLAKIGMKRLGGDIYLVQTNQVGTKFALQLPIE